MERCAQVKFACVPNVLNKRGLNFGTCSFQFVLVNVPQSLSAVMSWKVERVSRLFQPLKIIPKNATLKVDNLLSNSQKLMLENGVIRQSGNGMFHILPLGMRALEKLIELVDKEMTQLNAQKILLPALTDAKLWMKSGRWQTTGAELYKLKDRHNKEYILSPTHEEAISGLIASVSPVSHHKLPIRMYQISSKFRDEKKSRFGMIRGKEFLMKDLYTFDQSLTAAEDTYAEVCQAYHKVFDEIGVPYVKGDNGIMGGSLSHEYHFLANIGEDSLMMCDSCNYGANKEIFQGESCPSCKDGKIKEKCGIEVGHTFVLGSKYSEPLEATFIDSDGKVLPLEMGSYGLGMTRILAAAIESLSPADEIRWPSALTPYTVCIITPKDGSKEESASRSVYKIYNELNSIEDLCGEIIVDDRGSLTIGKRMLDAKKTGYPFVVVVGRKSVLSDPLFEVFDISKSEQLDLRLSDVVEFFREVVTSTNVKKWKAAIPG